MTAPAREVYLVDGARSPFLKARGPRGPFSAADLAVQTGQALLLRQPFPADAIDEVILGCVSPAPDEANLGRIAALRLGCGADTPGYSVQRNCASGMQALDSAALDIAAGRAELVLAGGVETMSRSPVLLRDPLVDLIAGWRRARGPVQRLRSLARLRPRDLRPLFGLQRGLTDPVVGMSMGQTAERVARRYDVDRAAMDAYALRSHQRLAAASGAGRLDEIVPLIDRHGRLHETDDGLRADTSLETLARLRPVFEPPHGAVTAGNSAQVSDGAAWLLLASGEACERHGLQPRARLIDTHWAALDPRDMGLGPVHAMLALLARQGLGSADIDAWEINEAFAGQVLACLRAWTDPATRHALGHPPDAPIPEERLNLDGGGISLGHPVGASGARIVLHLMAVLGQRQGRLGVASLCIGGGQGGAMLIERMEAA